MIEIQEKAENYVKKHRVKVQEIIESLLNPADKRKYLSSMGIYQEKGENAYVVRVRNSAGIISTEELKTISGLADLYSKSEIHFTTRQDSEFHLVTIESTVELIEKLAEVGLFTRGAGGNTVRNMACSTGDGVFDVTPYALKATEYLLKEDDSYNLPRKFKIAFSNSSDDTAYATIADIGFISIIKDNQKGFEVYAGGGLGRNPSIGIKIADFIKPDDAFYYIFAARDFFFNEGDRENRNKARLRYVLFNLGEEDFRKRFYEYLEKAREKYSIEKFDVPEKNIEFKENVFIHPECGFIKTDKLNQIIKFIEGLDYIPDIKLTNTQGLFISNLKDEDAEKLKLLTSEYSFEDFPITCVGATYCKIGLCRSRELAVKIKEKFKNKKLPKIYISGCHNSCGQHQIGEIGLSGKLVKTGKGLEEYFTVFSGGNIEAGKTKFGEQIAELPAENIPEFLFNRRFK